MFRRIGGSNTRIALASLALGVLGVLTGVGPSRAQAISALPNADVAAPPLRAGEYIVPLRNCMLVRDRPADEAGRARARASYATSSWPGECRNGLVFGTGSMGEITSAGHVMTRTYAYGRTLSRQTGKRVRESDNPTGDYEVGLPRAFIFGADGRSATYGELNPPFTGHWRAGNSPLLGRQSALLAPDGGRAFTQINFCNAGDQRCSEGQAIFEIAITSPAGVEEVFTCPTATTTEGCEALWQEKAGPVIRAIRAFEEQTRAEDAALIRELDALHSGWNANYPRLAAQQMAGGAGATTPRASAGGSSSGTSSARCGGTERESAVNFDRHFAELRTQYPQLSTWGSQQTYQYSYFLGARGVALIESYRACPVSQGVYSENLQALTGMRDAGKRGCEQLSSSSGPCPLAYPGQSQQQQRTSTTPPQARPLTCGRGHHPEQRGRQLLCVQDPPPQCGQGQIALFDIPNGVWNCVQRRNAAQ